MFQRQVKYSIIILFTLISRVQGQDFSATIISQANDLAKATMKGNYEKLVDLTYPALVTKAGGKETLVSQIKTSMESSKFKIKDVKIGTPGETVQAGDELHCLVPQKITIEVKDGLMITDSHLLAISKDNGKHWYFIDAAHLTDKYIQTILPNFNSALVIPPKSKPVFHPDPKVYHPLSKKEEVEFEKTKKDLDEKGKSLPSVLTFTTSFTDTTVKRKKEFKLTYTLNIPNPDLQMRYRPIINLPAGIEFINPMPETSTFLSKQDHTTICSMDFIYKLKGNSPGKFQIPPVEFDFQSQKIKSSAVIINVSK